MKWSEEEVESLEFKIKTGKSSPDLNWNDVSDRKSVV